MWCLIAIPRLCGSRECFLDSVCKSCMVALFALPLLQLAFALPHYLQRQTLTLDKSYIVVGVFHVQLVPVCNH